MGAVSEFLDQHFLHFNSRQVVAAARGWEEHLIQGGQMMVTLAGAMSTARIGRILARMIRQGKVHAITCTGANLEEDVFNLLAWPEYELIDDWRALRAEDDQALYDRGMNRVTDTCIPETVMHHLAERLVQQWVRADREGVTRLPSEHLFGVFDDPTFAEHFKLPREESWVLAAKECGVPVWTPGWEDSTTGNMFTAEVIRGTLRNHRAVTSGTEQFERLIRWYQQVTADLGGRPSVGFFQIGGGIAGDFPICAVPAMIQDLKLEQTPFWGYFCQISDAVTSYGGYSGAVPNEKITWGKIEAATPKFMIQSDATIVAPLIFAHVLGD